MKSVLLLRLLLTWFLFIPIAILNGLARNILYQPRVGELLAHQISTFTGSIAFLGLVYLMVRKQISTLSAKTLVSIGMVWVLMTILFEFWFGHFVVGHSWEKLLRDYNIVEGRAWIVFLIVCALSPLIVKRISCPKKTT